MKKTIIFEDDCPIIDTPMLSGDEYSSIATVSVYFNKYGAVVVSASNHDGATGYYSLPFDYFCSCLNDEALAYLLNGVQLELEKRNSKAIRTVIQWIEQDGQDMKKD